MSVCVGVGVGGVRPTLAGGGQKGAVYLLR